MINKESFLDLFKYFDFGGFNDVDELLSYFNNFIVAVLDIILPLKLFSFRLLSKRSPWFDIPDSILMWLPHGDHIDGQVAAIWFSHMATTPFCTLLFYIINKEVSKNTVVLLKLQFRKYLKLII